MNAVRVRQRGRPKSRQLFTVHWLDGPDRTACGRLIQTLDLVGPLHLRRLPPLEACLACERSRNRRWPPKKKTRARERS